MTILTARVSAALKGLNAPMEDEVWDEEMFARNLRIVREALEVAERPRPPINTALLHEVNEYVQQQLDAAQDDLAEGRVYPHTREQGHYE